MERPKGYVDPNYLDLTARILGPGKARSHALMRARPGAVLLDVGCGPGIDTLVLGTIVGSAGSVIGVDYDDAMVAEADRRAAEAGVSGWVKHQWADATALPFEAGRFDASRSERLFQHLPEPGRALAEIARVTRPGGWVVVYDTDWGSLSVDAAEVELERRLARVLAERCRKNGYAARQLYRLFQRQGFAEVSVELFPIHTTSYAMARSGVSLEEAEQEAVVAGAVTRGELERWRESLERAEAAGEFFASLNLILVAGRRPELVSTGGKKGS